jgi:hypothetical protein
MKRKGEHGWRVKIWRHGKAGVSGILGLLWARRPEKREVDYEGLSKQEAMVVGDGLRSITTGWALDVG